MSVILKKNYFPNFSFYVSQLRFIEGKLSCLLKSLSVGEWNPLCLNIVETLLSSPKDGDVLWSSKLLGDEQKIVGLFSSPVKGVWGAEEYCCCWLFWIAWRMLILLRVMFGSIDVCRFGSLSRTRPRVVFRLCGPCPSLFDILMLLNWFRKVSVLVFFCWDRARLIFILVAEK